MEKYKKLFEANRTWAESMVNSDAEYFERRSQRQEPYFLFIGGHDSRIPSEAITGTQPGEILMHRNMANQVHPNDFNTLSVIEYAVEVLDVKHIVIIGHYGCGGIKAAMAPMGHGIIDHWLHVVRELHLRHRDELAALPDDQSREERLVELNVVKQVFQLARTPIIQRAWARGQRPILHGSVYDSHDGLLRPLISALMDEESLAKAHDLPVPSYVSELHHETAPA
ncbi:MAG: carbonic anhydrase [Gammaproteobacteria bacterium]|jgi:carbonic anhydrase|nr:carbonic anhydrase [Gammaproteobacteria bacterium]